MLYLIIISLVVTGIVLAIQRTFKNAGQRKTVHNLLKNIAADKANAEKLAKNLYYKYNAWPCATVNELNDFTHNLTQVKNMGKFTLNHIEPLPGNRYLIVTTCADNDFELGVTGKLGNAKKVYNLNFLLSHDAAKQELVVSSENFYSPTDKSLRTSFANQVRQFF